MAILEIARLGNPVLRQQAQPVDLNELTRPGSELQQLIDDMIETMRDANGAGLAAPQVSRSLQIVVYECEGNERYPDRPTIPLTVLVNPRLSELSEETVMGWEGCLSLDDFRGKVARSRTLRLDGFDREGQAVSILAEGFESVVIQHETDHLIGKVFLDRMTDLTQLSYVKEFETFWVADDTVEV
ncbi:MAG: peptide deformylase [Nitrospinae bacterium CG11_big_fil_rev_8_21_14_0_20_45_15]|nr:MAG: peptide deformylase [Nitrospinae bacterium CG11_big_fil_rev_8_21_14_0_20_45_15]